MLSPGYSLNHRQRLFIDPNSGAEVVRQMRQSALVNRAMGGVLVDLPVPLQVSSVLDVYCGPGGWSLEVAFEHQDVEVVGVDASRMMVQYARAQASVQGLDNARFITMNVTQGIDFPDATFDLVNARFLALYLKRHEWQPVVNELVRVTKPGGLILLTECDEPGLTNSPAHEELKHLSMRALALNNQSFASSYSTGLSVTPLLRTFLQQAGCQTTALRTYGVNCSADTPAGWSNYENCRVFYHLGQSFLLTMGLATQEKLENLYEQMLTEMVSEEFRSFWYFTLACGQKPSSL